MSAGEVMRLTRIGRFDMGAEARGPLALLKRLRGGGKGASSSGRGQMTMLRELPKLLRFIPGTAQDVRVYFLALQYWLAGSEENLANMLRMLAGRYGLLPAKALAKAAPPIVYPEVGLYHPALPGRIVERPEDLPAPLRRRGNSRPAHAAQLRPGRERCPLRRRHRSPGGTRAARHPCLRERARPAPGH
jgi:magnesium chelatase subunit H